MEFTIVKDCKTYPHKKHWQYCVGSGHAQPGVNEIYLIEIEM